MVRSACTKVTSRPPEIGKLAENQGMRPTTPQRLGQGFYWQDLQAGQVFDAFRRTITETDLVHVISCTGMLQAILNGRAVLTSTVEVYNQAKTLVMSYMAKRLLAGRPA